MSDKVLCIIPARGGSKRIPRKNIKNFLGSPIISYSIRAALQSKLFDVVMVSTDDDEIARIAIQEGAEVPFMRSIKNADDYASTVDVLLEVFEGYNKLGKQFGKGCCLYPTAPFVNSGILKDSYAVLNSKSFDSVFPVLRYGFPIQRALKEGSGGKIEMFNPKYMTSRSQDLEVSYHDAGQFYFFNVNKLKEKARLWTDNTGFIEIDELRAQDIDNPIDWELAELKYKLLYGK